MTENIAGNDVPPVPPAPPTRQAALDQIAALKADPNWSERYLKGDSSAKAQFQRLHATAYEPGGNADPGHDAASRLQHSEVWRKEADLPADVLAQVRERRPVSADEYRAAVHAKERMLGDREWAKRYMDGGRAERREMALVSIILGSRIAAAPVK